MSEFSMFYRKNWLHACILHVLSARLTRDAIESVETFTVSLRVPAKNCSESISLIGICCAVIADYRL